MAPDPILSSLGSIGSMGLHGNRGKAIQDWVEVNAPTFNNSGSGLSTLTTTAPSSNFYSASGNKL